MKKALVVLALVGPLCLPAVAAASGAPAIVNGGPTEVRNREATLHFSIDPEGLATKYYVEYGETSVYGQRAGLYEEDLAPGDEPVALSELLSVWYLEPGTTYHYRVVASNADGTTYGDDQEITTTEGPLPAVATGSATDGAGPSVVLHGTVDPEGEPLTACHFHFVTRAQFDRFGFDTHFGPRPEAQGEVPPCAESLEEIGSGSDPVAVHAETKSLAPGEYFFRLEGENAYDNAVAFGGVAFTVASPPPPPVNLPPGNLPPSGFEPPGLVKAPGVKTAPGLHGNRRKKHRRHSARLDQAIVARR